jgi:predicted peptidase
LGFVLHHDSAGWDLPAVADVSHPEGDKITATQLAFDAEVEESKLARQAVHLQAYTEPRCP